MILELPMPPSANAYWRTLPGRRFPQKSPQARAYLAKVKRLYRPELFVGDVAVRLDVHICRGDLDNRIKVVLDALKGVAYVDDKQVRSLRAEKFEASTKTERVVVRVLPWVPVASLDDEASSFAQPFDASDYERPALPPALRVGRLVPTPNIRRPR